MSSFSFSLLSKKLKKPDGGEKSDAGVSGAGASAAGRLPLEGRTPFSKQCRVIAAE